MWLWKQKPASEKNLSCPQQCVAVNPGGGGSHLLRNVTGLWNLEKKKWIVNQSPLPAQICQVLDSGPVKLILVFFVQMENHVTLASLKFTSQSRLALNFSLSLPPLPKNGDCRCPVNQAGGSHQLGTVPTELQPSPIWTCGFSNHDGCCQLSTYLDLESTKISATGCTYEGCS